MRVVILFMALFFLEGISHAQHNAFICSREIIGFVSLPFHPIEGEIRADSWETIIRTHPDPKAPLLGKISSEEDLQSVNIGYDSRGTPVYARTKNWLQIETPDGRGWIVADTTFIFSEVSNLIDKLTYLPAENWDGIVYTSPKRNSKSRSVPTDTELDITIHEWKKIGDEIWLHVTLPEDIVCTTTPQLPKEISGWIPAYNSENNLVFWFFPGGC